MKSYLYPNSNNTRVFSYAGYHDAQIIEWYEAGWSSVYISRKLGVSTSYVCTRLRANGIKVRDRNEQQVSRLTHKEINETIFLYRDCGYTIAEVAQRLNKARSTIRYRLQRAGVTIRSRTYRRTHDALERFAA